MKQATNHQHCYPDAEIFVNDKCSLGLGLHISKNNGGKFSITDILFATASKDASGNYHAELRSCLIRPIPYNRISTFKMRVKESLPEMYSVVKKKGAGPLLALLFSTRNSR